MRSVHPAPKARFKMRPLNMAIAMLTLGLCQTVQAQEPVLEEIIITSLKRPQSLQDVPISVVAVTGDKIISSGIENLEDLTNLIPNMHFTETGIGTQLRIRGIGSDNSQGFAQSAGMYVDGIYHGRAQLFRAPVFDMERVEVMRGPQLAMFGKSSIAGAIELITAKPTGELEGRVFASHESEFGTNEISGVISGPISDSVNGRIGIRVYDDPGYMTNSAKNSSEANQDEFTIRASLDWQVSDNLTALLIAEHDTFDIVGRNSEATKDTPIAAGARNFHQVLGIFGTTYEPELNFNRDVDAPDFSDNAIDSRTLQLDYTWNDYTITSLSGHLAFDYTENCDCDFTPATIFDLDLMENYEQTSQEIRIASPENRAIEWVAGIYYDSYEQEFSDLFNMPTNSLLPTLLSSSPTATDEEKALFPTLWGAGISRQFSQKSESWAIFSEVVWNASDTFNITLGARFSEEEKEAQKTVHAVDITNNNTPMAGIQGIIAAGLFENIFGVITEETKIQYPSKEGHQLDLSRKESAFSPSLTVNFIPNKNTMHYAKISKGHKSGGFDPRSNNPSNFEFEEETVVAYEIGRKMSLADGRGELNFALFRMNYDNLQVSQFDGKIGFNVGNAKKTRVQGLELDGRWKLNQYLGSGFGFAYLDFEYLDFKNGNCRYGEPSTSNAPLANASPSTVPASAEPKTDEPELGAPLCDYTGRRGVYTPKYTVNGSFDFNYPINAKVNFISNLDLQWVDKQIVHVNHDGIEDAYTMVSMRIGFETENWLVAILGQNLLNEEVISYTGNTPLAEDIAKSNTHYSFVKRPRTLTLTGSYKF